MEQTRELVCICCPLGCRMHAALEDGVVKHVTGNTCPRGKQYAQNELTHPMRTLTTTVRVLHGVKKRVPVKTEKEIPKEKMMDCMRKLRSVQIEAPVRIGEKILDDAAGTGICVIASKTVEKES